MPTNSTQYRYLKAIANFSTSLHFHVRVRQAEIAELRWRFREMCRSVYEHAVPADVGRAKRDVFTAFLRNSCGFQEVGRGAVRGGLPLKVL